MLYILCFYLIYVFFVFAEDGFSFTSINQDTFYVHDGSNNFKDYAIFKIMGGPYSSLNRIDFMISPNDKESPVILDSTSLMASVIEGLIILCFIQIANAEISFVS